MLLSNCEVSLILTWFVNCVLTSKATRGADAYANPAVDAVSNPSNAALKITNTTFYAPVVTLSTKDNNKLLERLKTEFKRAIKWNKCRSEVPNRDKTNNLFFLIDSTFIKVNRLFVLSFKRDDYIDRRLSFSEYFMPKVEINVLNVLIDGKIFFDVTLKNKEETYEKISEMSKNSY